MWQVAFAVAGAWCIAVGAAAQERPAARATGREVARASMVLRLARDPRWLAGAVITVVGVSAHLVALSSAPVTIVQPLGVSGLLVAVWLAARWRGRFLSIVEIAGTVAVTLGLAGLVWTLPHGDSPPPTVAPALLAILGGIAVFAAFAVPALARLTGRRARALTLASAAGICFGLGSALARVVASRVGADPTVLWSPTVIVAVALMAVGGLLIQNAYRTGHFGLAYAALLIADPLIAAGIGIAVLGEGLPSSTTAMTLCLLSAAITVTGVIVLAGHTKPPHDDASPHGVVDDPNHNEAGVKSPANRAGSDPSAQFVPVTTAPKENYTHGRHIVRAGS